MSCVTYELWAAKFKAAGDLVSAGAFKRAAALSVLSLRRWKQSSGAWWIVKNRFDPKLRHGYEGYSYFSQYNLLPASMLATAYLYADDSIVEGNSFAETGGFAYFTEKLYKVCSTSPLTCLLHRHATATSLSCRRPRDSRQVIANAGGNYVEIELYPDAPTHDVLGLSRMHTQAADPLATGSAGAPKAPEFSCLDDSTVARDGEESPPECFTAKQNPTATGFGVAWQEAPGGAWQRLGDLSYTNVVTSSLSVQASATSNVQFTVTYTLDKTSAVSQVVEVYQVTPLMVNVTASVTPRGTLHAIALAYPALTSDGMYMGTIALDPSRSEAHLELSGNQATTGYDFSCGHASAHASCGGLVWTVEDAGTYTRNGFASVVQASTSYSTDCKLDYAFWGTTGKCL